MHFQEIISNLLKFWKDRGCSILHSYDIEVGAGTLSPNTAIQLITKENFNTCYVEYCRRPVDARYGDSRNRLAHYYQMQVIMKPSPKNIQEICILSLQEIGLDVNKHDLRFIEDDWKNPSIGASGLGYELQCDGMEVLQFTYMQQIGGIEFDTIPCEITYGLERLAMYLQGVDHYNDIIWNESDGKTIHYRDIYNAKQQDLQWSKYYHDYQLDSDKLFSDLNYNIENSVKLVEQNLPYPAYDFCLKASHCLNVLDARGLLSQSERQRYILLIRQGVKNCLSYINIHKNEI
jgi:glycyl-tRNA synthetase alpha chain